MNEWHKSSYSDGGGGNCVEVAEGSVTYIRDTRYRELGHLEAQTAEWTAFLKAAIS
ncbi:DUF397 domain-containing protein [Nocardiopsis sp. NPDC006938]|uniref:DUF397 domain-containing protein n=1 Tax=Nocardiopsis sp. NPDC006938 TaxID=3364337 RepID=UPI00367B45B0